MTEYMKENDKGGCALRILIQMAQDDNEERGRNMMQVDI